MDVAGHPTLAPTIDVVAGRYTSSQGIKSVEGAGTNALRAHVVAQLLLEKKQLFKAKKQQVNK